MFKAALMIIPFFITKINDLHHLIKCFTSSEVYQNSIDTTTTTTTTDTIAANNKNNNNKIENDTNTPIQIFSVESVKPIVDLSKLSTTIREEIALPNTKGSYGLARLVQHLFHTTLDKAEQVSDWEERDLRPAQVQYAAKDAFCLVEIYYNLMKSSKSFSLSTQQL